MKILSSFSIEFFNFLIKFLNVLDTNDMGFYKFDTILYVQNFDLRQQNKYDISNALSKLIIQYQFFCRRLYHITYMLWASVTVQLIVRILSRPLKYTGQSSCRSSSDYPRSLIKGKNKVFDSKLEVLYLEVTAQTEQGHLASKNL